MKAEISSLTDARRLSLRALKVAGFYALFGLAWILFSDQALLFFTDKAQDLAQLQTAKGGLFIFVTAFFVFMNIQANGGGFIWYKTEARYRTHNGGVGTIYLKSSTSEYGDLILNPNNNIIANSITSLSNQIFENIYLKGRTALNLGGNAKIAGTLIVNGIENQINISDESVSIKNVELLQDSESSVSGRLTISNNLLLRYSSKLSGRTIDIDATSINIESASIDATGQGYPGAAASSMDTESGWTFGKTTEGGSILSSGGSYGGLGGTISGNVNDVYGNLTNPNEFGSGGGSIYDPSDYPDFSAGGAGGGLIRLKADTLSLDGAITSDGGSSQHGGGSGGGIWINAGTITGSEGTISACGDGGSQGGGGRIAIYYDDMLIPYLSLKAATSRHSGNPDAERNGGAGTIYTKSSTQEFGELLIDNRGNSSREDTTPFPSVGQGTVISSTSNSLTASGVNWKPGSLIGLHFKPDINGPLIYRIANNDETTLYIDPADGDLTQSAFTGNQFAGVYTFDTVTVMGKAQVNCPDQLRILGDLTVDDAVLTAPDLQAGGILLENGGVVQ
jgi:hypothetical protein